MTTKTDESKHVKLFLRADAEIGVERTKEAAVETLTELAEDGYIADCDVRVWGRELRADGPVANTEYGGELLEHIREFREWATKNDVSLGTVFDERTIASSIADEDYTVVSLPTICLAVYNDDELVGVYPCHSDGSTCSVVECLETLRNGHGVKTPSV
ncbi:HTH domain-containing protein (plasmid) [Haloferax sp. S1W]|uniref:HTH domain-containing protein n=1 Tax=Haloferax sp. S1W TaxID=3377110 RepID=UPI0037C96093